MHEASLLRFKKYNIISWRDKWGTTNKKTNQNNDSYYKTKSIVIS